MWEGFPTPPRSVCVLVCLEKIGVDRAGQVLLILKSALAGVDVGTSENIAEGVRSGGRTRGV